MHASNTVHVLKDGSSEWTAEDVAVIVNPVPYERWIGLTTMSEHHAIEPFGMEAPLGHTKTMS